MPKKTDSTTEAQKKGNRSYYMRRRDGESVDYRPVDDEIKRSGIP